jgi:glycosyltransferase involved in cell wall biosynthesis
MTKINPLEHPVCLQMPQRLTSITSWHGHIPFAMFLVDVLRPKMIVELGTHYGDSYCAFCQAIKYLKLDTRSYAVDTWQGDSQSGFYGPEVLADLRFYHDPLYGSFSRLIQSTFDEALTHFNNETIDLLHIDGYHIYDIVKHDFESWLPKVSPQGVLLLHDINVLEKDYGARKFWDEIKIKFPHFEFLHSHGLGIIVRGKTYSKELQSIIGAQTEEIAEIRDFFAQLGNKIDHKIDIETKERENQNQKKELIARDCQIYELNCAIQNKDSQINTLESTLGKSYQQISELENSLQTSNITLQSTKIKLDDLEFDIENKTRQVNNLKNILKDKQIFLKRLETELENTLSNLGTQLEEKNVQVNNLETQLEEKNIQVYNLETQLQQIMSGIPMRLRNKYQRVIEKVLPQKTKRRRYYQRYLTGIRIILNDGWVSFFHKVNQLRISKRLSRIKVDTSKLKELPENIPQTTISVNKKVSLIIPTKNAGQDFEITLERIKGQKGVREIELIVVDSGSTDGTDQLANNYGAKVFAIPSEEFNHGTTRNFGAVQTTGDYLLFTVQDAIPIGDYWIHNMIKVLEDNNKLAAVTCRQIPRSDADLFACFSLWNHNRVLEFNNDKFALPVANFNELSPLEKRKLAGLEDVCALIKKDVFDKFKYSDIPYAEDLELGIKLIQNGLGIAFLYSSAIIHSHNRTASYFLKRSYVDNKMLPQILSYDVPQYFETELEFRQIFNYINTLYSALNKSINCLISFENAPNIIANVKSLIETNLRGNLTELNSFKKSGNELDYLFDMVRKIYPDTCFISNDQIIRHYFNILSEFEVYLRNFKTLEDKKIEFISSLYQMFAIVAGSGYANYHSYFNKKQDADENLIKLDRILSEAI